MIQYIVFIGTAVHLLGTAAYIKNTLKGKTKPNRVTYTMWATAPMIGTVAAISDGVTWTAVLPVFMAGFAPLLTLIATAFNKEAYWKLTRFDYICGIFSVIGLIMWWITKQPETAILFAVISDILAGLPTIIKSWRYPETETGLAYAASNFNVLTGFFAINVLSFSALAFPIASLTQNTLMLTGIYRKKFIKAPI